MKSGQSVKENQGASAGGSFVSRHQPYEEYKESGVQWLREIPEHWTAQAIKYGSVLNPSCQTSNLKPSTKVTFLPMEFVKGGYYIQNTSNYSQCGASYNIFEEGDIIIAKVTPCFENGNISIANKLVNNIGFGSSELFVIRCNSLDTNFMFYYLQNTDFKNKGEASMTGAGGLKRVSSDCIQNHKMPFPPLPEQKTIAAFLDYETGKIDLLIKKQQDLIALLEEKRQAVISHAVTKGLNPNVPMKNSNIESIGLIPEHWTMKSLSLSSKKIAVGLAMSVTDCYEEKGVPIIRNQNIKEGYFDGSDMLYLNPAFAEEQASKKVSSGDVLIVRTGSNVGLTCCAPDDFDDCHTFTTLIVTPSDELINKFFTYCMNSAYGKAEVNRLKFGFGKDNLNVGELKAMHTLLPSVREQNEIIMFLERHNSKMDELIAKAKSAIELMQERRTALISAAVTGKIDVRDWEKDKGERMQDKREEVEV